MASTYTTNLGIEKIGTGEQSGTWGDTTNTNFDILDEAINGIISVTLSSAGSSGSPTALPITDGASSNGRNKFIEFVDGGDLGGTAYVQLTPNNAEKVVHIRNSLSSSRSVIVFQGTYNASNDFEIANGADVLLKFNGGGSGATVTDVNVDLTVTGATVGGGGLSVSGLTDINGGTVDGTVIGGASAAAGTFTTITGTTITASTAAVPDASDGATLGSASLEWSDLYLADGAVVYFGDDQDITLTHVADTGLTLKHANTGDDKFPTFLLATGDTDIAASDKLGVINFQAPDEGAGTDAILVAAGIEAVSEGDFSSSSNATSLVFKTASSEAAAEKMRINSSGNVGIGTTSPDSGPRLHLSKGSAGTVDSHANSVLTIEDDSTAILQFLTPANEGAQIRFGDPDSNGVGVIEYGHGTNNLNFHTAGSERLRIDSSGGVIFKGSLASHQTDAGVVEYSSNLVSMHSYGASSGTGQMRFLTGGGAGSGTSEAMRIDASGNVGIGTASPSSYYATELVVSGSDEGGITLAAEGTTFTNYLAFADGTSGDAQYRGQVRYDHNDDSMSLVSTGYARILTGSSRAEAMRVDSSGNVLVGCTSFGSVSTEGCQLGNSGTAIFSNDSDIPLYLNRTTSGVTTSQTVVSFFRNDVQSGTIGVSQGGTPAFGAPSDIRLKENVTDHKSELTNVMALRPVSWDWKDSSKGAGEGFVAQELDQTAWSDLVSDGEDGYKMVSGLGVVETRLIKALQEAVTRIETLEAEVAALKGE
jgi:hypothetical protein